MSGYEANIQNEEVRKQTFSHFNIDDAREFEPNTLTISQIV